MKLSFIGKVEYVDYELSFIPEANAFSAFLHKRKNFEHEQEVRAMMSDLTHETNYHQDAKDGGKYCAIDIGKLVHGVVVSPFAPSGLLSWSSPSPDDTVWRRR